MSTPQRTYRALFITHDAGMYGAARSLQLLIGRFGPGEVDVVLAKRPFRGKIDEAMVRSRFGPAVARFASFFLPLDYCYRGQPGPPIVRFLYESLLSLLWIVNQGRFRRMLREGNYDFIHLNSLTLHRLVSPHFAWIIHVREILDHMRGRVARSFGQASGVVFIDATTADPFKMLKLKHHVILPNPTDMRPPSAGASELPAAKLPFDPAKHTVFSMIGKITADKGVRFIVACFRNTQDAQARLLVIGAGDDAAEIAACRSAAGGDPRIVFWGEEPDIGLLYRISDYIVRGESYFCVGRTMYEGLYAGCSVIIPGSDQDRTSLPEQEAFRDRILFYRPRDAESLTSLFDACSGKKVMSRTFQSNVDAYVRSFQEFIAPILRTHR